MQAYLADHWGASFSPHRMGQELIASLDSRYQILYDFLGADAKDTFVFTSSVAEAINQVLWSVYLEKARSEGKCHFIVSALEDAPTMQMMQRLEEMGCFVKIAPVGPSGQVDLEILSSMINPRTALVSCTMADGLTGVLQPVEEIAKICWEKGALLHLDATYAVGKFQFSFADLKADYLTFSGDRIHSVKSSGGLFVKEKSPLSPLILGGPDQGGFRGGSFDVASFVALTSAISQSQLFIDMMGLESVRLRDLFEFELMKNTPEAHPLFTNELRLPNTTVMVFPNVHAEALLYVLNRKNVFASMGGPYAQSLSRVLQAMGIESRLSECALSFSLSRYSTEEEILKAAALISQSVIHLRSLSEGLS